MYHVCFGLALQNWVGFDAHIIHSLLWYAGEHSCGKHIPLRNYFLSRVNLVSRALEYCIVGAKSLKMSYYYVKGLRTLSEV